METVQAGQEPVKRERDIERVYRQVNEAWGRKRSELPALDGAEAITAVKALRRFATKEFKTPRFKGRYELTSGNRYTWIRRMVYYVNPDRGWWNLVHDVAHKVHFTTNPGTNPHDAKEAYIERAMIEYVVRSGWLDGKLKRPEKSKAERDVKAERHKRVLERLATWERKKRRAETAIKKLTKTVRYYERLAA